MAISATAIRLDPTTGLMAWEAHPFVKTASPKADFAFRAATLLHDRTATILDIELEIFAAANAYLKAQGRRKRVRNLKDLQAVSGTACMWFQEIKRVASSPEALEALIEQDGEGLTTLYRKLGPTRFYRPHKTVALKPTIRRSSVGRKSVFPKLIDALVEELLKTPTSELILLSDELDRLASAIVAAQRRAHDVKPRDD